MSWGTKEVYKPTNLDQHGDLIPYTRRIDQETVNLRNLDKAITDPLWALADGLRKLSYGDMMKLAQAIDSRQGPMADRLFNWAVEYIDPPPTIGGSTEPQATVVEPSKPERRP